MRATRRPNTRQRRRPVLDDESQQLQHLGVLQHIVAVEELGRGALQLAQDGRRVQFVVVVDAMLLATRVLPSVVWPGRHGCRRAVETQWHGIKPQPLPTAAAEQCNNTQHTKTDLRLTVRLRTVRAHSSSRSSSPLHSHGVNSHHRHRRSSRPKAKSKMERGRTGWPLRPLLACLITRSRGACCVVMSASRLQCSNRGLRKLYRY